MALIQHRCEKIKAKTGQICEKNRVIMGKICEKIRFSISTDYKLNEISNNWIELSLTENGLSKQ